ncbi:6543_t:CDS:1 [Entrophospora sp. SA101]|nr:6543_t:CDS:1 [Entrophospora sp. SA101]
MDLDKEIYGPCTPEERTEYCCWMPQVRADETPGESKQRIWDHLMYFRENGLFPSESKKYLEARKLIRFRSDANEFWTSYVPEIGIAICFSYNQLVYIRQSTKSIGNYNHIGMEKHWTGSCTGNKFRGISFEVIKLRQKAKRTFGENFALHRYGLWEIDATEKSSVLDMLGK